MEAPKPNRAPGGATRPPAKTLAWVKNKKTIVEQILSKRAAIAPEPTNQALEPPIPHELRTFSGVAWLLACTRNSLKKF
jgi:hypothetical protein